LSSAFTQACVKKTKADEEAEEEAEEERER
jgi:hypothetical protein